MLTVCPIEYKRHSIEWDDRSCKWHITIDGVRVKGMVPTLEECEKWIDSKAKKKYVRTKVLFRGVFFSGLPTDGFVKGEITSLIDDGYVWFVGLSGRRRKESIKHMYTQSDTNMALLKDALADDLIARGYIDRSKELVSQMTKVTPDRIDPTLLEEADVRTQETQMRRR